MKPLLSYGLIVAASIAAAALGFRILRSIRLLAATNPEETVFFGWSFMSFLRWLLIAISPIILYGAGFALYPESVSSLIGKTGFCIQIVYVVVLIVGCVYVHRFVSVLSHHA